MRPELEVGERIDLAAAVAQAGDGIVITDTDGTIQFVNPAFTSMTGYSSEEAVGRHTRMLNSGRQPASFYESLWSTIAGGEEWLGEMVNRRKDGAVYDEEMRITPLRGTKGQITGYLAVKRDLTERRAVEEATRLLTATVESSDDAIVAFNPAGIILTWNRSAELILGYSGQEAKGNNVSMLIPPERSPFSDPFRQRILSGHTVLHHQGVCLAKDGRRIHVSISACPIKNSEGEVVAVSLTLRDISERREAMETRAMLASIVECSSDAIIGVRLDGSVVSWNRGAQELFGYSNEEIVGQMAEILHPEGHQAQVRKNIAAIRVGGTIPLRDTVCVHKDGSLIDVSISVSVTRDSQGQASGAAAIIRDISQRLRDECKVRETEERFRVMADGCPAAMWVTNAQGGNEFVNRAYLQFTGLTHEQLEGNKWEWTLHPEDAPEYVAEFLRAVREQTPFSAEVRVRDAQGAWRWFASYGQPRFSAEGKFLGHVGLSPDITERKEFEQAQQFQHSLMRAILEVSPDGILATNKENIIVSYNRRFMNIWDIPPSGISENLSDGDRLGEPGPVLSSAVKRVKDPEAFLKRVRELNENPTANDHREIELKDGRTLERYSTAVRTEAGELQGRVWFFRDVTKRAEAERSLRASEEKFRQLAENIREVFWMVSPSGETLYISPAYEQVWGRTCQSLYDNPKSWLDSIHPDDLKLAQELFVSQLRDQFVKSEYRILTPGGEEKWICDRAFSIRNEAGETISIVGIAEEITEQKRYEAELILAREGAEVANEAKSRFLATMSHEIRTPMNGVIGMIQLLLQTGLTSEQRRYATVADSSGHILLALIDDILDLSKIEARKIVLEKVNVDLRQTVGGIVQLLSSQAADKGLRVEARVSPEIPALVRGDPHRLGQIITNLCANAIKFTERGEVTVEATLLSQQPGASTIRFAVSDTGIGIPAERAEEIFSPFIQADVSTTRKYGGSGLGLAISKQLVALMDGSIGVDSEVGKGSTFWFTAVFETPPKGAAAERPVRLQRRAPGSRRRANILIAEDNAVNREVALALVQKLGHKALAVKNGAEAVVEIAHARYDLILMDCEMPVMDGFEATRRIRDSIHQHLPIVALTANAMSADRERCLQEGMSDYLSKPVDLAHLEDILQKWLPSDDASGATGPLTELELQQD